MANSLLHSGVLGNLGYNNLSRGVDLTTPIKLGMLMQQEERLNKEAEQRQQYQQMLLEERMGSQQIRQQSLLAAQLKLKQAQEESIRTNLYYDAKNYEQSPPTDEEYKQKREEYLSRGVNPNIIPEVYDPIKTKNFINTFEVTHGIGQKEPRIGLTTGPNGEAVYGKIEPGTLGPPRAPREPRIGLTTGPNGEPMYDVIEPGKTGPPRKDTKEFDLDKWALEKAFLGVSKTDAYMDAKDPQKRNQMVLQEAQNLKAAHQSMKSGKPTSTVKGENATQYMLPKNGKLVPVDKSTYDAYNSKWGIK